MLRTLVVITCLVAGFGVARAGEQDAVDGCIDSVRAKAGGGGGQVLSADKQGASWYVHLEDGSGGEWDCYAADNGKVEQLTSVTPVGAKGGPVTKEARQACRKALREKVGAGGIEVQSAEFSEANTLVMLTDKHGDEWRCLSSNRGEVAELTKTGGGGSAAESECIEAVAKQVGGPSGLSVESSSMGENYTTVIVRVPQAQKPWECKWGGNGVESVTYMGEG